MIYAPATSACTPALFPAAPRAHSPRRRALSSIRLAALLAFFALTQSMLPAQTFDQPPTAQFAPVSTPTIVLTAYSMDGANSGTARLARSVTVQASTPGISGATLLWTLTGAGSLTSSGVYTAPTLMPSNGSVTITATMASNPAVTSSYQLTLIYAVPTIRWIAPASLFAGATNTVSIVGYDFSPLTTILVGGVAVPATYQAPSTFVVQVPVSSGSTQPVAIQAVNPVPGGGVSLATQAAVQAAKIVFAAYSIDGTNSGTARLRRTVTIQASTPGVPSDTYTWTVNGAGTVSSTGVYTAPAAMPANTSVTVTATSVANPSASASYQMSLLYSAPTIRWIQPSNLLTGTTNTVALIGYDFTPATRILVGGSPVPATFQAPETYVAQIPIGPVAMSPLSLTASNPAPGGGVSAAVVATVQPLTISVNCYNKLGLNPWGTPLGREVQFVADVQGSGNPSLTWPINWSVKGGGTISSTGLYVAPSAMPHGQTITITATLVADAAIQGTGKINLINAAPVINQASPTQVAPGATANVTFAGEGFQPTTVLLVNGNPIATTYVSNFAVSAAIPVSAGATAPLSITAQNPAPGGGTSSAYALAIAGSNTVSATIGTQPGLAIPGDFLGLSHDWNDAQAYMGSKAVGVNTIYRQLVQNLSNPGSLFFIRIGGGSTDSSVAPTPTTIEPFVELATAMPVRFSLGVNLGANNLLLAQQQAADFVAQMPAGSLAALEIGNEPDLYGQKGYRPSTYNLAGYISDLTEWKSGILSVVPSSTKLMGASWASPWFMQQNFSALEQQHASSVSIVSQHFYEGDQSGSKQFAPNFLLLDSTATAYVGQFKLAAAQAHSNGQLFRVGEMNSVDDGGLAGVSNTFSSALWSVDTMFEYATAGVDGVNFHGTSGCLYCAFTFGIQGLNGSRLYNLQQVNPLYYGLLFFHQATTNNPRLLPVTLSSVPNVKVWATVDQAGTAHVVILNKDQTFDGTVAVTLPGYATAAVSRLVAPSYQSTVGISIGDQTFDGSLDGTLVGTRSTETLDPSGSVYEVTVQPTSAVLLTLPTP